jgi:hypothetical protein
MDSSKFFNRKINVRDPKTPYQKGKVVEESKNYSSRVFSRVKETSTTKSLLSIRRKVFQIENSLQSIFNLNKKSDKVKQRFAVVELEEERNNKKLSSPATGLGNLIQRPKTGAMDMIKNFVTFTFLGWLFTTLQPLIGKLEWIFPLLKGAFDFIGGTVKFLVESLGSFIKFGYDVYDGIKSSHDEIKQQSSNLQKTFDETTKSLGDLIDGTVKVATSFLDVFKETYDKIDQSKVADSTPAIGSFSSLTSISNLSVTTFSSGGNIREGRIDPRTPITRGISSSQRRDVKQPKPNIQAQKTTPGKDVGGEAKVKEVYGEKEGAFKFDFIPLPSFFRTDKKSGYNALISASEEYKKPKSDDILGIGNLMGAAIDTSLGQKPEKKTYTQFADGLKYLVDYGMTNPEEFNKIDLEQMVRNIVEPKVEIAINKIREEINKKSSTEPGGGGPGGARPGGGMGDSIESIDMGGFSAEDIDALGRMIAAESAGESSIGKAGVLAVILNRYRLIKSGAASPGAFNVTGKTKEQVTIRDVLFARNEFSPYRDGSFERTTSSSGRSALAEAIRAGGNDPEKLKKNLIDSGVSEQDADYVVRSVAFSNPNSRGSRPFNTREITVGRHVFQQSPNVSLTGPIGRIEAQVRETQSQIQALSSGFRTGLKTGPAGRIGAGTEYHVDARFIETLPLRDKIAMLDSMAAAHAQEGFVIEFSGRGVAGDRWNPNAPLAEKEKLARKVLASHHTPRPPFQAFDYFIVKRSARDRYDRSAEGSNIMAPIIDGGTYEYQIGGGQGRHLIIRDKNGNIVAKILHGDEGLPSPKEIGKVFKMDELKESKDQLLNKPPSTPPPQQSRTAQTITPRYVPGSTFQPIISEEKARNYADEMKKIKPGSGESLRIPGVGTFVQGRDIFGRPEGKYFKPDGTPIKEEDFLNRVRNLSEKKKYGGLVYKNSMSPNLPEEKYASYNNPMNEPQLIIQPIMVPTLVSGSSGSNSSIIFAVPRVNSTNNSKQLMRS